MNTNNRKQAEINYKEALFNVKHAENVSEAAYHSAKQRLETARSALIEAEALYTTAKETKTSANKLRLRNRGLDC